MNNKGLIRHCFPFGRMALLTWISAGARQFFPIIFVIFLIDGHAAPDISYQIKASYIYNILQFVSFPDEAFDAQGILKVCILGEDRFGEALKEIEGARTPQGKLKVVRMGS